MISKSLFCLLSFLTLFTWLQQVEARRRGGFFVVFTSNGTIPWWSWILIALSVISIIWAFCKCFKGCSEDETDEGVDKGDTPVYCHLCCKKHLKSVKPQNRQYNLAERTLCMEENKKYLEHHPLQPQLISKCGYCGGHLRKWTSFRKKDSGMTNLFHCSVHDQNQMQPILNTDDNRFACFVCDFNLCSECLHKSETNSWNSPPAPNIVIA